MTTLVVPSILDGSSLFLQTLNHKSSDEFEFRQDSITDFGAALERLKNQ